MRQHLCKRCLLLIPVLLGITILVFSMRAFIPGDPVDMMLFGQMATQEHKDELRAYFGLDRPLPAQYVHYMSHLFRGDLGNSIRTRQPVLKELMVRYPNTIRLAVGGLTIAIVLGITAGVMAAVGKDGPIDFISMTISLIGVSMPAFWLGLLLIFTFGVRLGWFPVMGSDTWRHLILPSFTLGFIYAAIIARMTRSTMLEVLSQDYVRTARAKGLSERVVTYKHALRNAMIPVVTILGLQFGYMLGGAFIIEVVFAYRGVGELAVQSIQYRDFPMIQAITLVVALSTVLVNLGVDVVYSLLNPQVRYG